MTTICPKHNLTFCDCELEQAPRPKLAPAPKPKPAPVISREDEVRAVISAVEQGRLSREDADIYYKDLQRKIRKELQLIKYLSSLLHPQPAKTYSIDDFPLKG